MTLLQYLAMVFSLLFYNCWTILFHRNFIFNKLVNLKGQRCLVYVLSHDFGISAVRYILLKKGQVSSHFVTINKIR